MLAYKFLKEESSLSKALEVWKIRAQLLKFMSQIDKYKNNLLHHLCKQKYITQDLVEDLLYSGIDINSKNSFDNTPLFKAIINRNTDLVRVLLENGANINIRDSCGKTVLYYSFLLYMSTSNIDLTRFLLEKGITYNIRDLTLGGGPSSLPRYHEYIDFITKYNSHPIQIFYPKIEKEIT